MNELNVIPPDFLANQPDIYQPYFILREHVIDRIYDQNVGYWEANLQGLAHPGRADRAELLVDYLDLSESQIAKAADRLSADGKYEMAAALIESAEPTFPGSGSLDALRVRLPEADGKESEHGSVQIHHLFGKNWGTHPTN